MKNTITKAVSFNNCKIIGLVTQLDDYRLAYFLNKFLKINLIRCQDIVLDDDRFSYYYFNAGDTSPVYSLVSLKYKSVPWSSDFAYYDFFLVVRQCPDAEKADSIVQCIFNIKDVFSADLLSARPDSKTRFSTNARHESGDSRVYSIKETTDEYQDFIDIIDNHEECLRQGR